MRSAQLFISLLLAGASTAWPSGSDILQVARRELAPLIAPRATTKYNLSYSSQQGNTATTSSASSGATGSNNGGQITGSAGNASQQSTSATRTTSHTSPVFDPRLPAGGLQMVTPSVIAGAQYYKVGDWVTFAWNYTSVSIMPTAVDILASCKVNQATYTISLNQTIPTGNGSLQTLLWDTAAFPTDTPLVTSDYTLIVYDAASSVSAVPRAGYFGVYNQFTFGMYTPQPYTPLSNFVCATCNGAMSAMEKQTYGFLFATAAVTVLSFTWFASAAGIW